MTIKELIRTLTDEEQKKIYESRGNTLDITMTAYSLGIKTDIDDFTIKGLTEIQLEALYLFIKGLLGEDFVLEQEPLKPLAKDKLAKIQHVYTMHDILNEGVIDIGDFINHHVFLTFLNMDLKIVRMLFKRTPVNNITNKFEFQIERMCLHCGELFVSTIQKERFYKLLKIHDDNDNEKIKLKCRRNRLKKAELVYTDIEKDKVVYSIEDMRDCFCSSCKDKLEENRLKFEKEWDEEDLLEKMREEEIERKRKEEEDRKNKLRLIALAEDTKKFIDKYLDPEGAWGNTPLKDRLNTLVNQSRSIDCNALETHIKLMNYKEFLKTPYWKAIASWNKYLYNYSCGICGGKEKLNTHYKTYEIKGRELENLEEFMCICSECYTKFN